ncbi:hypothetical protein PPL_04081 [Heterostelium album PN500]|uniref:Uncharacterized protein n=1 Tax=Heterostelium pallidum (strain ATCC 26659 / Pp 5 / PN500) TaxID=670386 RepID=D3B5Z3_HETP5|nr:hypothetical protein PPL_04081 [Heterostelium album PN500]EFA83291.1 hypothetical protein PPL_04081 [Heterostelium album PN500]|eukprot:XP_020435408.1 hypothetical protein PPL_04081 [Heterostelium album PN500]
MGCNQSTAKDKQEDRQRTQPANNAGQSTQTQTASKQIGVPNQENEKEPDVSYSQMREMDNDFFKDIIDRTAQKFIDVSTVGPDAKDSFPYQEKDYSSQIKETTINKSNILYSLPHLSQSCQPSNLHNLLSQPVPFDTDLMSRCSSSISSAVNNINIKDCGELVSQQQQQQQQSYQF